MSWKDRFATIVISCLLFIVVIWVLFRVLEGTEHSPTDLMTNPGKDSFIGEFYE